MTTTTPLKISKRNMISGKCLKELASYHMLYGTAWKKEQTTQLVLQAFDAGFRGVDTVSTLI